MKRTNEAVHVKSRLIAHFGLRLILAGVFLTLCTVLIFAWMVHKIQEIEINRDFSQGGVLKLGQSMTLTDGIPTFDERLLEQVRDVNGWLQLLNEDGEVIYSLYAPPGLPDAYRIGELTSYWNRQDAFPLPYDLYLWTNEVDGTTYTLLYGMEPEPKRVLRLLKEIDVSGGAPAALPGELAEAVRRARLQVQLLDAEGKEIASYHKFDTGVPAEYTLSELALRSFYSERYRARLVFDYDEETQTTWVVTAPLDGSGTKPDPWNTEFGVMLTALLVLLATSIVLFSALSIWYANRFGTPVLHIIDWLQHLSAGQYDEPRNRKGRIPSLTAGGKLRRPFRLFSNVIQSLKHLSRTLRQNEEMRRQLEQTREEWIAGVSHDMKTPLSSIKGYSHMLEAGHYNWSEDEVREFAGIILEKADYMETLIDDLSLTYRLKNKALPLDLRETDAAEFLQDVIRRFRKNPRFEHADLKFHAPRRPLRCRLDARWMSRAIENLLVNAFVHNPSGTKVSVSVAGEERDGRSDVVIEIRDDGEGMDPETASQLFERYYRGSNTADGSAGSGLGMAIARQIILAHGGEIAVESEIGKGTVVAVRLPEGRREGTGVQKKAVQ